MSCRALPVGRATLVEVARQPNLLASSLGQLEPWLRWELFVSLPIIYVQLTLYLWRQLVSYLLKSMETDWGPMREVLHQTSPGPKTQVATIGDRRVGKSMGYHFEIGE